MFYQMITNARNRWFASSECTAQGIIAYIEKANQMRDAQIDAIKTYLYLKIACGCAPLAKLFCQGAFNTLDLEQEELSAKTRTFLLSHPAAAALFEYACLKTDSGEQVSEKLEKQIRKDPESINYVVKSHSRPDATEDAVSKVKRLIRNDLRKKPQKP